CASDALDGMDAGNLPDGAHHVVQLFHVDDLDLEGGDRAVVAVGPRVRLQDVHADVGERLAHLREQALAVIGAHPQVHGALELAVYVPSDFDSPLGVRLQRFAAGTRMHRHAAPARDESDDLV